ncbi:hypothetical protein GTR02_05070 [Kineococcus sp. R8]|uniref:hypothetical protein n=1 Tax=Kineococcus siccus TaxID=2696567 RepID=UPI00196A5045|nr:hypothetical protein [Kineococcus siccus]NAZ81182.1 hypothetical protein [Kineococcus siccus]
MDVGAEPVGTAFDAFAATAMPRLRHLAHAWFHDWHRSDDAVQDTMRRVDAAQPRVRRGGEQYAHARTTLVRRLIARSAAEPVTRSSITRRSSAAT